MEPSSEENEWYCTMTLGIDEVRCLYDHYDYSFLLYCYYYYELLIILRI